MADKKYVTLVQRLNRKTREGKIAWEETSEEDVFQAVFPDYSVAIFPRNNDYVLQVFNSEGKLLVELDDVELDNITPENVNMYEEMQELHENARHEALDVDDAIDDLLTQL